MFVTELAREVATPTGALTCQCVRGAGAPLSTCATNDCEGVLNQLAAPLAYAPQAVRVAPMPSSAFNRSPFYDVVKSVLGLFFVAIFAKSLAVLLGDMITEKETGIREMLSLMGMSREAHMASWYITYGITFGITSIILGVVCSETLFSGCDAGLLVLMFFFFLMALLSYAFAVSALFDKAKLGQIFGTVGWFAMAFGEFCF